MNVRITPTIDGQRTVLQVAGRLQLDDISELEKETGAVEGTLVLDLSELMSADKTGIVTLRTLKAEGAELRGVSQYVRLLLKEPGS